MQILSRRRIETILLAVLAIVAVSQFRFFTESRFWLLLEMGSLLGAFLIAESAKAISIQPNKTRYLASSAAALMAINPVLFAFAARAFGSPIAFEISALASVGAASLAMAAGATTDRTRSLSLVLSGFLVLFCASMSDHQYAVIVPLTWMLGCVWHLIANHWERLDLAMPDTVERTVLVRPSVLFIALIVLSIGGYVARGRMSTQRLAFGLMPTSGGSKWSDPAARSGVGTGEAAIAAKDHAESFGAVDSDIFLESTESSLFDMVNEAIGEPMKKNKWERRQAMGNENVIPMHEQAAKSEQGGGSFSTERMRPKKHEHFKDAIDASVVQWDGPTGIRLAMQRYDTFDGTAWTQSENLAQEKLSRVDVDDAPWFLDPDLRYVLARNPDDLSVGLLKVIRLDSQRIPTPMLTAGIHIKEIDRQDFFGIADDGSFFMPGREKVPPLTVVHVASIHLMEDEIRDGLEKSIPESKRNEMTSGTTNQTVPATSDTGSQLTTKNVQATINDLVQSAIVGHTHPFDQLSACIDRLRNEFVFSRDGGTTSTSLSEFLRTRCGGDDHFATAAALMARQLGLSSRLVTGFYVRPDATDITAGHASVLPQDVHMWAEVKLRDGRWFEIEATPGYKPPRYQPSFRLLAQRYAAAHWPAFLAILSTVAGCYVTRRVWIDWLLSVIWSLAGWLRPHRRIRLAIRIIETRAQLAGECRPAGKTQRAWLEQLTSVDATLAVAAQRFSDAADALFFGGSDQPASCDATGLVDLLHVRTITALTKEAKL